MANWKTNVDTIPLHTVLIASDQPQNISAWENLFQQRNCIVLAETSVPEAVQTARLVGPSLMLVDMNLPWEGVFHNSVIIFYPVLKFA